MWSIKNRRSEKIVLINRGRGKAERRQSIARRMTSSNNGIGRATMFYMLIYATFSIHQSRVYVLKSHNSGTLQHLNWIGSSDVRSLAEQLWNPII